MGRFSSLLVLSLVSRFAWAEASADKRFEAFVRVPTASGLASFKEDCAAGHLSPESLAKSVKPLKARGSHSIVAVRGLIYMFGHCADGALSETLNGLLGVGFVLEHPRTLLGALTEEGASENLLSALAASEGGPGESPFNGCDSTCLPKVKKFFLKKFRSLKAISASGKQGEVKDAFLKSIEEAEAAAENRFGGSRTVRTTTGGGGHHR